MIGLRLPVVAGVLVLAVAVGCSDGSSVGSATVDEAEIEDQVDLVLEDAFDKYFYVDCPGDLVGGEDLECDTSIEGDEPSEDTPAFDAVTVRATDVDGDAVQFSVDAGDVQLSGSARSSETDVAGSSPATSIPATPLDDVVVLEGESETSLDPVYGAVLRWWDYSDNPVELALDAVAGPVESSDGYAVDGGRVLVARFRLSGSESPEAQIDNGNSVMSLPEPGGWLRGSGESSTVVIPIPDGQEEVTLSIQGEGVPQTMTLPGGELGAENPRIFYRQDVSYSVNESYRLPFVLEETDPTFGDVTGYQNATTVLVRSAILTWIPDPNGSGRVTQPPSSPRNAWLLIDSGVSGGNGWGGVVNPENMTIDIEGQPPVPATVLISNEDDDVFGGAVAWEVPADINEAVLRIRPGRIPNNSLGGGRIVLDYGNTEISVPLLFGNN